MLVHSDIRVVAETQGGRMTLTGQVRSVSVQDGLDSLPQATVTLPLHRTTQEGRRRYSELIAIGDLVLVEMLGWDGKQGDWEAVIHGPVVALEEREGVGPEGEAATILTVASMAHYLSVDAVARWMWYGSLVGWKPVETFLSIAEMMDDPATVAYKYLTKVAFHLANWHRGGSTLADYIHLDMDGLQAVGPYHYELQLVEGSHLEVIRRILDSPLHELYVTTDRARNLRGRNRHVAGKAPGEGRAATVVRWRKAPYPFPGTGEWEALPLHRLEGAWQPVRARGAAKSDAAIRNFFLLYPGLSFTDENLLLTMGIAVANRRSIERHGYRPMKIKSLLVHNEDLKTEDDVKQFWERLTRRMAAQWNRLEETETGTLELPLAPWIRPGDRVLGPSLWGKGDRMYHVRARQLHWEAASGGRMVLAVERGLPPEVYRDASWFEAGLEVVRAGAEIIADLVRGEKRR